MPARQHKQRQIMHRFIPGLAKHPEKRKITQTEKRQLDCIYDRSKRNRGISRNLRSRPMHGLLMLTTTKKCNVLLFEFVLWGWARYRRYDWNPGEIMRSRPMKAGLVKSLAD